MNSRSLFTGKYTHWTAIDPEKDAGTISGWTRSSEFVSHYFDGIYKLYPALEVTKRFKECLKKGDESKLDYYFAIREIEGENLVGLLHLGRINSSNQASWFSVDLQEDGAFENYGSEVLAMALRYAFMELSLYRLFTVIPSYNEMEIALFEKMGFLREVQRRQAIFHEGKYLDALVYALLRPDWKKYQMEDIR